MKTLLLLRHAKSSWENPNLKDHERPLLQKGLKRTGLIIKYMLENTVVPDFILSSPAVRAYDTAKAIAEGIGIPVSSIVTDEAVYKANVERLYDIIYALPGNKSKVMIIGHNPCFTSFSNIFLEEKIDWMPTSAMLSIDFDVVAWEEIPNVKPVVNFYITPKKLKKSESDI